MNRQDQNRNIWYRLSDLLNSAAAAAVSRSMKTCQEFQFCPVAPLTKWKLNEINWMSMQTSWPGLEETATGSDSQLKSRETIQKKNPYKSCTLCVPSSSPTPLGCTRMLIKFNCCHSSHNQPVINMPITLTVCACVCVCECKYLSIQGNFADARNL